MPAVETLYSEDLCGGVTMKDYRFPHQRTAFEQICSPRGRYLSSSQGRSVAVAFLFLAFLGGSDTSDAGPITSAGTSLEVPSWGGRLKSGMSSAYDQIGNSDGLHLFGRAKADLVKGEYKAEAISGYSPYASEPWLRMGASGQDTFYFYDKNDPTSTRTVHVNFNAQVHGKLRVRDNSRVAGATQGWANFDVYNGSLASPVAHYRVSYEPSGVIPSAGASWVFHRCIGASCTNTVAPVISGFAEVDILETVHLWDFDTELGDPVGAWFGIKASVGIEGASALFWDTASLSFSSPELGSALLVSSAAGFSNAPSDPPKSIPSPATWMLLLFGLSPLLLRSWVLRTNVRRNQNGFI